MKRYRDKSHVYVTPPDAETSYEDRLRFVKGALDVGEAEIARKEEASHQARLELMRYGEGVTVQGREMRAGMADRALDQALGAAILSDAQYHAWFAKLNHAKETQQVKQLRHVTLVEKMLHNPDVFLDEKRTEQVDKLVGVLVKQYDVDDVVASSFIDDLHKAEYYRDVGNMRVLRRLKHLVATEQFGDALGLLTRAAARDMDDEVSVLKHANRMERITKFSQVSEQLRGLLEAQALRSPSEHAQ